jgi:serine/threonine-protein kinase RsbW
MVRLELASKPESPTLVRALLSGLGVALAWDEELVDDLKTAVSEACNNVVVHAYRGGVGKLIVRLDAEDDWVEVVVCDEGEGLHGVSISDDHLRVGLPVISSLAERADFLTPPEGGTEVRMFFRTDPRESASPATATVRGGAKATRGPDQRTVDHMIKSWTAVALETLVGEPALRNGEVAGAMAPVGIFGPALGRLVRAFAAVRHFRLDRFSDLRVITDTLGAHARTSAAAERLAFAIGGRERRLELVAGPFAPGSSALFARQEGPPASPLGALTDELTIAPSDGGEIVRMVLADRR